MMQQGNSSIKEEHNNDKDQLKKKREDHAVEIRNLKRQEHFNKFRKIDDSNINKNAPTIQQNQFQQNTYAQQLNQFPNQLLSQLPPKNLQNTQTIDNQQLKNYIDQCLKKPFTVNDFPELLTCIYSQDLMKQHYAVIGLRKILSVEDGPPIQMVIDANIVPRLIDFIKKDEHPHLQLESAWALTNIASGTSHQTQAIIDKQGIPLFTNLLKSPHVDIAEQAIWALGNIAGDCALYRDMILKCGAIQPLIKIIETTQNKNTIKHGTWALSNLCRGRPLPSFDYVKNAIPTLAKVLHQETDSEVLTDAAWAMSYLSDGDEERIQLVIETGVISALVKHLDHPYLSIVIPCLRSLGNIVTGTDEQTNLVLSSGAVDKFFELLNHPKRAVRRESCWSISNITAGNEQQISLIVKNDAFIEKLMSLIQTDVQEIKREAAWVLSNATSQGSTQDIRRLVDKGLLELFVTLLDNEDIKCIQVVLESINNILKKGKDVQSGQNLYKIKLEQLNAVDKIEKLQFHQNEDVYLKSIKILENFFEIESII